MFKKRLREKWLKFDTKYFGVCLCLWCIFLLNLREIFSLCITKKFNSMKSHISPYKSFVVCSILTRYFKQFLYSYICPWCNGYRRRKWTRRQEFKSWTRLVAFHIALIPLGKVWIQLFSLQLWVNSRAD